MKTFLSVFLLCGAAALLPSPAHAQYAGWGPPSYPAPAPYAAYPPYPPSTVWQAPPVYAAPAFVPSPEAHWLPRHECRRLTGAERCLAVRGPAQVLVPLGSGIVVVREY